jgi:hypothetical protein
MRVGYFSTNTTRVSDSMTFRNCDGAGCGFRHCHRLNPTATLIVRHNMWR